MFCCGGKIGALISDRFRWIVGDISSMPRRNATGVVCIFLIWGIDDVYIVLFSVKPLTVTIGRTSRPPPRRCTVTGIEISPFGPGEGRRSRLSRITTRRDPRAFFRLSTTRPLVGRNVHTLSGSDRISTTTTARTPYTLDCGLDARRPRFDPPARSDVLPGGGRRVVGSELILPVFFLLECIMYEPKILTIHSL